MMMTEETTAQRYRGVLCGHCRQPIPLPGIVDRLASAEAGSASDERSVRSFHLRCRVCEREKTYHMGDITEFEGTPRVRSRAHGSQFGHVGRVARAAHV
ncbi:MAG TPA: hypothetical protein VKS44_05295 [Candidatus Acidoferrales bacterium]|nr:hypothetical protein [Candidatus Acidoferrales bacterium]